MLSAVEVLPVAPPLPPRQLTEEEAKRLEEQEEDTLRELRLFLRDVTTRLSTDKRFKAFTKPVDLEEVLVSVFISILTISQMCRLSDTLMLVQSLAYRSLFALCFRYQIMPTS